MREETIQVETYSGQRYAEYPRRFRFRSRWFGVAELLETRIEERVDTRERRRYFLVRTGDGRQHEIAHDLGRDKWFLIRRRESSEKEKGPFSADPR